MKLKFYARESLPVRLPDFIPTSGSPDHFVGRHFIPPYPALERPFECDSDSSVGRRLLKRCRDELRQCGRAPLWPADVETAAAIGVPFVAVEFKDGAWVESGAKESLKFEFNTISSEKGADK